MTKRWTLDPDDPRSPSQEVWDAMSPEERAEVVASLPAEVPLELHPPEGDPHRIPKERARDALDQFFKRVGRRVYVSSELATYYPDETRFCPDILAVLDVEPHERMRWVVLDEGKGLDLVIEVHVGGYAKKDFELNVTRYARLGIPEYFIFDRPRGRIVGYHLPAGAKSYERIVPQAGRLKSEVLGLDLVVEDRSVRFYCGTAPLLFAEELAAKLDTMLANVLDARDSAMQNAEEETRRAEEETRRADALACEVTSLKAEIERMRQER